MEHSLILFSKYCVITQLGTPNMTELFEFPKSFCVVDHRTDKFGLEVWTEASDNYSSYCLYVKGVDPSPKALILENKNNHVTEGMAKRLLALNSERTKEKLMSSSKGLSQTISEHFSIWLEECKGKCTYYAVRISIYANPYAVVYLDTFDHKKEAVEYYTDLVRWNVP